MPVKHARLVVVYSVEVMIAGHVLGFENNTSMKGLNRTVQRFADVSTLLSPPESTPMTGGKSTEKKKKFGPVSCVA